MPKATLTFQLPEEQAEFDCAVNGTTYSSVIDEVKERFRNKAKYEDGTTTWSEARELLTSVIDERLEDADGHVGELEEILKLVRSVASEDTVRDALLCFTQGTALLEAIKE